MFHVFAGYSYYPCGGLEDYVGSYATLDEAKQVDPGAHSEDWGHIATVVDGKMVWVATWERPFSNKDFDIPGGWRDK